MIQRTSKLEGIPFTLRTAWGRKHGWEVQFIFIQRRIYARMTGRRWCHEASTYEVKLWRALPKKLTTPKRSVAP